MKKDSKIKISDSQHNMILRIENYNISFVIDKLVKEGKVIKGDEKVIEMEFKKFIILVGMGIKPLAMISPYIDEVWHQYILFTKQYMIFCTQTVGFFINHQPDTDINPIPIQAGENFRIEYKRFFGEIPDIWYKKMNRDTKQYYLQPSLIGKPPTDWSGWTGQEE